METDHDNYHLVSVRYSLWVYKLLDSISWLYNQITGALYGVWWTFSDRCFHCGGAVSEHINGKHYCDRCGQRN